MGKNQDIEKIFSNKLKNYQLPTSESDWLQLNQKLKRFNFFRFSLITFNIYYLTIFFVLAGTATYSGIKNYSLSAKVKQLEKIALKNNNSAFKASEVAVDSSNFNSDNKPETVQSNTIPLLKAQKSKKENSEKEQTDELNLTDTIKELQNNSTIDSIPVNHDTVQIRKKVKKIKKTIYVKPSDVLKRDTVIISKPK